MVASATPESQDEKDLRELVKKLWKETGKKSSKYDPCCDMIEKLLGNIISNPNDEKYLTVKL